MAILLQIHCVRCRSIFHICPGCFRNQKYCGASCRDQARRAQKKASNKRHRESVEGRLDNRDRVRAHRARKQAKMADVMDHTPDLLPKNNDLASDRKTPKKRFGLSIVAWLAAVFGNLSEGVENVDISYFIPTCCDCGVQSDFVFPFELDQWRSNQSGRSP